MKVKISGDGAWTTRLSNFMLLSSSFLQNKKMYFRRKVNKVPDINCQKKNINCRTYIHEGIVKLKANVFGYFRILIQFRCKYPHDPVF